MFVLLNDGTQLINISNLTTMKLNKNGVLNLRHVGGYCENVQNVGNDGWDEILRTIRGELGAENLEPGTEELRRYHSEDVEVAGLRAELEERGIDYDGRWGAKRLRKALDDHKKMSESDA